MPVPDWALPNKKDDGSTLSPEDRDLTIRTMIGEESSLSGRAGVGSVILNRASSGKYGGKSASDVVLSPGQFETWDDQPRELMAIARNDPRYVETGQLLDGLASGQIGDPTNGATHFYAPKAQRALGREPPAWAQGDAEILGDSAFYAPDGRVQRTRNVKKDVEKIDKMIQLERGLKEVGQERQTAFETQQKAKQARPPAWALKSNKPPQWALKKPQAPKEGKITTALNKMFGPEYVQTAKSQLAAMIPGAPKALYQKFIEEYEAQQKAIEGMKGNYPSYDPLLTLGRKALPIVGAAGSTAAEALGWGDPFITGSEGAGEVGRLVGKDAAQPVTKFTPDTAHAEVMHSLLDQLTDIAKSSSTKGETSFTLNGVTKHFKDGEEISPAEVARAARAEKEPWKWEPDVYTIRDFLGAKDENEELQVRVYYDKSGKIEYFDDGKRLITAPPAFKDMPAQEAVAHMFGSHPMNAPPDLSLVKPKRIVESPKHTEQVETPVGTATIKTGETTDAEIEAHIEQLREKRREGERAAGMEGAPEFVEPPKKWGEPISLEGAKQVGPSKGTTAGGIYELPNGQKYYVKLQGENRARNEMVAAALARAAGAKTFDYHLLEGTQGSATGLIDLAKNNIKQFTPEELNALRDDFAIHAWLANWDVAGLDLENMGVTHEGDPIALDWGGALYYRAQGVPKGQAFNNQVDEWLTLRVPSKNPQAAAVFGKMTTSELISSAERVAKLSDEEIRAIAKKYGSPAWSEQLGNLMVERKNNIAARLKTMKQSKPPEWAVKAPKSKGPPEWAKTAAAKKVEKKIEAATAKPTILKSKPSLKVIKTAPVVVDFFKDMLDAETAQKLESSLHKGEAGQDYFDGLPGGKERIKRAKDLGYSTDLTLYHGTNTNFLEFDLAKNKGGEAAIFATDDPKIASSYHLPGYELKAGKAPQVIPLWAKFENPLRISWPKYNYGQKGYSNTRMKQLIADAILKGHDSIIIKGIHDLGSDKPQTQYAFLKPQNLRAKYGAAFNPKYEGKANMLGAAAAPPGSPLPTIPTRQSILEQSDRFQRLRGSITAFKAWALNLIDQMPAAMKNPATMERLYYHMEDPSFPLTPQEQIWHDTWLAPLRRRELDLYEEVKKTDLPVKDFDPNYVHRMVVGKSPQLDSLYGGTYEYANPIQGYRSLPQNTSSMEKRVFFALEGPEGKRMLVSQDKEGHFRIIEKGQPAYPIAIPKQAEPGDMFKIGGEVYQLRNAKTREIEANTDLRYYKNAVANTLDNIGRLESVSRSIFELERLKSSPEWAAYVKKAGDKNIPHDWRTVQMPVFRGYYFNPKLANVMDDFYGNYKGSLSSMLAGVNRIAVSSMFWSPVVHSVNAWAHWVTGRGWDWITPRGIKSLAMDGATAMREVFTQGEKYQELLQEGSGMVFGSVMNQEFYRKMMNRLGENIKREPWKWDPIARTLGIGPSDLVRLVYEGSSRALWAANDVFMMQRVLENERKGLSTREAIAEAERHIPNYRIPPEVLNSRALSLFLQNPVMTEFSRYHYGMMKSYAEMAKDIVKGTPKERWDAAGNVMATAFLMTMIWPALNWAAEQTFGDNAKLLPRGSMTLAYPFVDKAMQTKWAKEHMPAYMLKYYNGDADLNLTLLNLLAPSPILRTGVELWQNTDLFSRKPIYEPEDIRKLNVPHVAGQIAEELGERFVNPYYTLERILANRKNVPKSVVEQALGISEPNRAGKAYVMSHQEREANRRHALASGPIERGFNYLADKLWPF